MQQREDKPEEMSKGEEGHYITPPPDPFLQQHLISQGSLNRYIQRHSELMGSPADAIKECLTNRKNEQMLVYLGDKQ